MHRLLLSVCLLAYSFCAQSQDFSPILRSIEQHSTSLKAARMESEAIKADTRTETTLADPELGVNYLFGNNGIGNRWDLSLSQSFDFPTVMAQRRKMVAEQQRIADLTYLTERQQTLLAARKLCIEVVYCNAMMDHLNEDLEETRAMSAAYQKLYDKGEATIIDRNKAHQAVLLFEAEYREFLTLKENLLNQLQYMNGGIPVSIADSTFEHVPLNGDFEQWSTSYIAAHPTSLLATCQVSAEEQALRLAKSRWAPGLRVGYMSEFEREDHYQGVSVGISVPVWGQKRRVKAAKTHLEAAVLKKKDTEARLTSQLRAIHAEVLQLQETYKTYTHHLHQCDNSVSLQKSLEKGQITLLTYLQERQYVHEMHEKLLNCERDLELRKAELTLE